MSKLTESLPDETIADLRRFAITAEDVTWPATVAKRRGWRVANAAYQAAQRAHGQEEMEALLRAGDMLELVPAEAVPDVLLAATELFLHTEGIDGAASLESGQLRLDICRCPLYDHFTDPHWRGLTACGCFARMEGWQDALGVSVDGEVLQNRKWGDPVCEVVLHLPDELSLTPAPVSATA